jgi:hypothetical protein
MKTVDWFAVGANAYAALLWAVVYVTHGAVWQLGPCTLFMTLTALAYVISRLRP